MAYQLFGGSAVVSGLGAVNGFKSTFAIFSGYAQLKWAFQQKAKEESLRSKSLSRKRERVPDRAGEGGWWQSQQPSQFSHDHPHPNPLPLAGEGAKPGTKP